MAQVETLQQSISCLAKVVMTLDDSLRDATEIPLASLTRAQTIHSSDHQTHLTRLHLPWNDRKRKLSDTP